MKIQPETTSNDAKPDKPNSFRLALLSLLALGLFGRTLLANDSSAHTGSKTPYTSAQSILLEVHAELEKTPCRFSDKSLAEARLAEMPALIASWQQTARVEPSELLRSLERIRETTSCAQAKSAVAAEVERLQGTLEKQLEQDVRSLFARLRRAQREGDRKGAYRHVTELRELLTHHQGPYTQHLERLARLYGDP